MLQILITILLLVHQVSTESNQNTTLQPTTLLPPWKQFRRGRLNFYKYKTDGCMFKEINQFAVWYGPECLFYPSNQPVSQKYLKIRVTGITTIKKNDLRNLDHLTMLIFEHNLELSNLEPGCFRRMKNLTHLKMTLNYKLKVLQEDTFEGLDSLAHLSLRKNGFANIRDIFQSLISSQIPKLTHLDLSENVFKVIQKTDLHTMNGSNLEEFHLSLCSLRFIHNESLVIFKKLKTLCIDGNHFYLKDLKGVVSNFIKYDIQLESLNLQDSGYRKRTPFALLKIVALTNISRISMALNQFEVIDRKSFPLMHNLRSLDLSDNIIITIGNGAFKKIQHLEELYLAGNKFAKVYPAILVPTLKILDLSRISNKPTAVSYFSIEDNIFQNLTRLEKLYLSYNLLESTNTKTFTGLTNLRLLEMKNTTIFSVRENTFRNTPNLTYLDLENNKFKAITLNSENFAGLSKLETLLLGGCDIANLSIIPSPFVNLKHLVSLSLNSNVIYSLEPHVFAPITTLKVLDLSNNKLIPWNRRLFENNSLKSVDLSMNKFTMVTKAMLEDFQRVSEVILDDNPFICDCNLIPGDYLEELLATANFTNILDVNCTNLDFKFYSIRNFIYYMKNNTEFCQLDNSNQVLVIVVSSILVIIFLAMVVLLYYYRYYVKYWLFLIKMAIRRHSKWWKKTSTEIPTCFQYDAFVSYSCSDNYFVSDLVANLENTEPYLKLCIYERDFKIGSIISEEIMQNIVKSKRTLLIISEGFAKSQWCRWETKLAEHYQLFFQNDDTMCLDDTLVMVKLNDVSKKHITPTLKYLMKTRIYLEWNESKEQEFWNKLRSTLAAPKNRSGSGRDTEESTV